MTIFDTEWNEVYNELGFWIEFLERLQDVANDPEAAAIEEVREIVENESEDDYILEIHDSRMPVKGRLRLVWEVVPFNDFAKGAEEVPQKEPYDPWKHNPKARPMPHPGTKEQS